MYNRREEDAAQASDEILESIEDQFLQDWHAGRAPTLESYVRRFPERAPEITEFVLAFHRTESAAARMPDPARPSPAAMRGIDRARARLGLGPPVAVPTENVTFSARSLSEARQAKGLTAGDLAQRLFLPNMVVVWLERGQIRQWPAILETRLAEILGVAASEAAALLRGGAGMPPAAPAHYSASVTPERASLRESAERTFEEALMAAGADPKQIYHWQDRPE